MLFCALSVLYFFGVFFAGVLSGGITIGDCFEHCSQNPREWLGMLIVAIGVLIYVCGAAMFVLTAMRRT